MPDTQNSLFISESRKFVLWLLAQLKVELNGNRFILIQVLDHKRVFNRELEPFLKPLDICLES